MTSAFLHLTLTILYFLFVSGAVVVALLDNRQPAKTIAWILVIILLPFVGIAAFYFFGQNVRKERIIERKEFELLTQKMQTEEIAADKLPRHYRPLIRVYEQRLRAYASCGNDIELLPSGADFLMALLRAFAQAKNHIHFEIYIIEDDAVGRLISDALIDAVGRGVEVRLLYDDVGCWRVPAAFFRRLENGGVYVHPFMPVRFPSLTRKVNFRNHRKVCIVDGEFGFIGGMNAALRYVSSRRGIWRDLHLKISGGAVGGLQRIFLDDWRLVTDVLITEARFFPSPTVRNDAGALVQIVWASPVSRFPEILFGLTWAMYHTKRYLYLQTPYFMPTEPLLQAMQTTAMAGADVRLMVPRKPDGFWLRWANDSYFTELLRAGVRIFTFLPGQLHSKVVVMDDDWCSVGSSNLDFRSFEDNFEANAFIYDTATVAAVKTIFLADQENCEEILPEQWEKRPWRRRLLESATRIFSPLF